VHNFIPEYASTASIYTVMTMPFHVKPFEKKVFEEVIFLLKYHQNPPSPRETEHRKKERKILKKEKKRKRKKKEKEEEKEKLIESLQIKGKSIF
jgi:hypothetical protein